MPKGQVRAEQAATTRRAILTAARRLFVEQGYFGTATEEIVAEARVGTRGALYHHFADKRALFLAVFEEVERDLRGRRAERAPPGTRWPCSGTASTRFSMPRPWTRRSSASC